MQYLVNESKVRVSNYRGYYYRDNVNSAAHKFDIKSLTYIEADARIAQLLKDYNIVGEDNLIVPSSVQYFVYRTARQRNRALYDYIHEHYAVKCLMRRMIKAPRLARKGVAYCYLILGKTMFYKVLSLV